MDRFHSFAGKRNLDWFFSCKRWLRTSDRIVEAAYAVRPTSPEESRAPLQFLMLAPKRALRRAHDRNRVKRWLREAVRYASEFAEIERLARERKETVAVMLRVSKKPETLHWEEIRTGVQEAACALVRQQRKWAKLPSIEQSSGTGVPKE